MSRAVADAYAIAVRADLLGVRQALACLRRDDRVSRLLLEGILAQYQGEAARTIELLRRAFRRAEDADKPYIADLLAPLLAARHATAAYEEIVGALTEETRARPSMCALEAMRAALEADQAASQSAGCLARERLDECQPLERARTLQRLAHAAYYRGDFVEALDSASESAGIFERIGAYRSASGAYSIVYAVHYSATGDFAEALRVAGCMTALARRSNDASYEMASLVAEYELAAELAEDTRFFDLQRTIRARPLPEQYAERFARGIADALSFGWAGDFDALRANAAILVDQIAPTRRQRAFCHALRSLAETALGEREEAMRASRKALELASLPQSRELAAEGRYSRLARGLAAATCLLIGDKVRGYRALAARGLRDSSEVRSLLAVAEGTNWHDAYPSVRGYARVVALVRERVVSSQRPSNLTPTELSVLALLADGMSAPQIARATSRSVHTIHAHTRGIIAKLGVSGRVAAISQARKSGLIP
jgi:DNA-binding CsgD family transcriptional regulator/tetratricopeptide (TPR) repeat protein